MDSSISGYHKKASNYPTLLSVSIAKSKQNPKLPAHLFSNSMLASGTPQNRLNTANNGAKSSFSTLSKVRSNDRLLTAPVPLRPFDLRNANQNSETPKFPTTPEKLFELLPSLPDWTRQEMLKFPCIYFISTQSKQDCPNFDDIEDDYNYKIGDDFFYRYEIMDNLGKGTFGRVVKAFDHLEKKPIALKIIKNKQRYYDQALIEVELLEFFNAKSSNFIVKIENNFVFRRHMVYSK